MEQTNKASGVSVAALICGIFGFFCSPFYLVNLAAIILGIVGLATANGRPKGMATAGLILGITGAIWQFVMDIILTIFTMGFGGISFFI